MSTLFVNNLNTASGTTITIPTGKTLVGTDEGAFRVPGAILQVIQATTTSQNNTTSTSFVDTGLTATITPKSSSSKILVMADYTCTANNSSNGMVSRLVRGSTALFTRGVSYASSGGTYGVDSFSHLDSPSTTSATTYKVQFTTQGSSTQVQFAVHYSGYTSPMAHMTLVEIAG